MSQILNKVDWCLRKAEREIKILGKHRGLLKDYPNLGKAKEHLAKADHFLKATDILKREGFSDISASTAFYAMYPCLLSIADEFGYESGNQECTFALIENLIDEHKISFNKDLLHQIARFDVEKTEVQRQWE